MTWIIHATSNAPKLRTMQNMQTRMLTGYNEWKWDV